MISHEANLNLARHTIALMEYDENDVLYTAFPLFHINARYTSVIAAMECGGSLVMDQSFSVSRFWSICRAKGVTAFNFQGALLLMLFKQPPSPDDADNPVRVAFGAPIPAEIGAEFMERFGVQAGRDLRHDRGPERRREPDGDASRSAPPGRETINYEVRVVDEQDRIVPAGVAGEIVMRPKRPGITVLELLQDARGDDQRRSATCGSTPATAAVSTRTATSTSSTG